MPTLALAALLAPTPTHACVGADQRASLFAPAEAGAGFVVWVHAHAGEPPSINDDREHFFTLLEAHDGADLYVYQAPADLPPGTHTVRLYDHIEETVEVVEAPAPPWSGTLAPLVGDPIIEDRASTSSYWACEGTSAPHAVVALSATFGPAPGSGHIVRVLDADAPDTVLTWKSASSSAVELEALFSQGEEGTFCPLFQLQGPDGTVLTEEEADCVDIPDIPDASTGCAGRQLGLLPLGMLLLGLPRRGSAQVSSVTVI